MNVYLKEDDAIFQYALDSVKYRERTLIDLYSQHQKAIIEKIEAYTVDIESITRRRYQIARLENLYYEIDAEIIKLMRKVSSGIQGDMNRLYSETYYRTAFNIERVINTSIADLSADTRLSVNYATLSTESVEASLFGDIAGHTFTDRMAYDKARLRWNLRTETANAIVEGIGPRALARRLQKIDDVFNSSASKSIMTARAELLRAYSLGQEELASEAERAGVEFEYKWRSTLDSRTRPSHGQADGQKAKIVDGKPMFNINGVLLSSPRVPHPSNTANSAKEVIYCRCRRQNIPFGIESTRRMSKLKDGTWQEVNGDMNYKEWYNTYYKAA